MASMIHAAGGAPGLLCLECRRVGTFVLRAGQKAETPGPVGIMHRCPPHRFVPLDPVRPPGRAFAPPWSSFSPDALEEKRGHGRPPAAG